MFCVGGLKQDLDYFFNRNDFKIDLKHYPKISQIPLNVIDQVEDWTIPLKNFILNDKTKNQHHNTLLK